MSVVTYESENMRPAGRIVPQPAPVQHRIDTADALDASAEAESAARSQTQVVLTRQMQDAKGNRSGYVARVEGRGQQPDQATLDDLDAEIRRAEGALEAHQRSSADAREISAAAGQVNNVVRKFARTLGSSTKLHSVRPRTDDINALEQQRGPLQAKREKTEQAPDLKENVAPAVLADFRKTAEKGRPRVRMALEYSSPDPWAKLHRAVGISWPVAMGRSEPVLAGEIPLETDTLAVVAWLGRKEIEAALMQDLDEKYRNVDLALSPDQRRKELARLDSQILILEYEIAALAWKMIDAGDDGAIRHLVGLDPRAILGVAA